MPREAQSAAATLQLALRLKPDVGDNAVIQICGVANECGTAQMSLDLGRSFVLMGWAPVLVGDFCFPPLKHRAFAALEGRHGLLDSLADDVEAGEIEVPGGIPGLRLARLASAKTEAEATHAVNVALVMNRLRATYRVSLLSAGPLLSSPSSIALAAAADGVILAIASGQDRRDEISASLALLDQIKANVIGSVLVE